MLTADGENRTALLYYGVLLLPSTSYRLYSRREQQALKQQHAMLLEGNIRTINVLVLNKKYSNIFVPSGTWYASSTSV